MATETLIVIKVKGLFPPEVMPLHFYLCPKCFGVEKVKEFKTITLNRMQYNKAHNIIRHIKHLEELLY